MRANEYEILTKKIVDDAVKRFLLIRGHEFAEDEQGLLPDSCGIPVRCGQPRSAHER